MRITDGLVRAARRRADHPPAARFSLIGFPLDDVWHRLFGQDVTLWGPTHLMLIGGAALSTLVGLRVLLVEGAARRAEVAAASRARARRVGCAARRSPARFLIGLSTFQAEFDFGVPQFRLVFQPMLIMLAAGDRARRRADLARPRRRARRRPRSSSLIRGAAGAARRAGARARPTPHFPLYLVEALLVEARRAAASRSRRPVRFGAVAGALIGTVGLAAEWGWSHVWMPCPWPRACCPRPSMFGARRWPSPAARSAAGSARALAAAGRRELAPAPRWAALAAGSG